MLVITDIAGNTEMLTGYKPLKRYRSVSGEKTLSFLIMPTEQNQHSIEMVQEESVLEFKGDTYRIKQAREKPRGNTYIKEVVAINTLFDLVDDHIYEVRTQSMTFQMFLQFVFAGTPYTWDIVDTFYAQDWENFGDDNRLSLFQEGLKRYGSEFTLNGTHFTFKRKIGNAMDFQFRYNYNIKTLNKSVNTNNLSTYIKGFGKQNEDGTYVVQSEYTSPNVAKFGIRHAKPVRDERYATLEGLNERLIAELKDTPDVSITIDFADMRRAGFPFDVPNEGDDTYLIYEPMGIDVEARIIDITEEFTENSDYPIKTDVTLSNLRNRMIDQFEEFSRTQKTVDGIMDGSRRIPFNALDEAVKRATAALQSAETELTFENGIIARDKNNPNFLVLFNSNGIGISRDGGQTFKEALTSEGFVASAGVIGQFEANNIQIGADTTFADGYNPKEIIVASKNMMQNSGNFVGTDYWALNGGTVLEVVSDNGRNILHCKGSIMGSNVNFIKPNTEYVFSAEVYFNKNINVTKYNPLHFWLGTSGETSAALESYELISANTSLEPYKWHIIAIKIKTKAIFPTGSFFKPFIYDPVQISTTEEYWIRSMMFAEGNKLATWSPSVEDTNSAIVSAATGIKNDLRMSAPLPTSLTLNQDGITASTSNPNKYARMDYRGFYAKQGAVQIERPDGYLSVQDGILRNSLSIQGSEPAFQTAGVEKWGQFYRTNSNNRFENIQRFVFKHDSRYVRIICNLYADGGEQYGNWANAAFDIVTDDETTSIATAVVVENRWSDNQGYRKDILIDCGVPTGNLLVMYWRMWSLVNPYHTYGSVRYLVQEG
ncbi:phage tail protein [Neobacillus niacini]|uniref:phage tail protein n=1 Tax=Neobacillus niacini TaxID=86668 RepID=UPI003B027E14